MRHNRHTAPAVRAVIGFAAEERGRGIAYARVAAAGGEHLVRVPFRVERLSGLDDREVTYAAVNAVARTLLARGTRDVTFALSDRRLADDLAAHADVPAALVLLYVRLRCTLNQLDSYAFDVAPAADLTQRARAETALNVAA
jgi:hypothetical protein